jgi:agmatinase
VDRIVQALPEQVYLSFDIDGLDPYPLPAHRNAGAGRALASRGHGADRRRGALGAAHHRDGPERGAPRPEGDEWDGNVGARLLYKMIGWALRSQRGGEGR